MACPIDAWTCAECLVEVVHAGFWGQMCPLPSCLLVTDWWLPTWKTGWTLPLVLHVFLVANNTSRRHCDDIRQTAWMVKNLVNSGQNSMPVIHENRNNVSKILLRLCSAAAELLAAVLLPRLWAHPTQSVQSVVAPIVLVTCAACYVGTSRHIMILAMFLLTWGNSCCCSSALVWHLGDQHPSFFC